ncbi:MAG: tripartite tricarboxylate transporter substrate binding protein, partial [Betaproteobacteria bacterium]|nr:tripartite tricarboxylate transporter substrate binding protein [Betaproteobacteria bacterium]
MRASLIKLLLRTASSILLGTLAIVGGAALAQSYPERPIRIIVPSTAGGALDTGARLIAPKMSDALNQAVIVENRPGAGGHIAQDIVAKAQPDGYTILFDAPNLAIGPALYRNLAFNPA